MMRPVARRRSTYGTYMYVPSGIHARTEKEEDLDLHVHVHVHVRKRRNVPALSLCLLHYFSILPVLAFFVCTSSSPS